MGEGLPLQRSESPEFRVQGLGLKVQGLLSSMLRERRSCAGTYRGGCRFFLSYSPSGKKLGNSKRSGANRPQIL